jgi:hypothetical protein
MDNVGGSLAIQDQVHGIDRQAAIAPNLVE